jgi:hypothetical protein
MHRTRLLAAAAAVAVAVSAPMRPDEAGAAGSSRLRPYVHATLDAQGARSLRRAAWVGGPYTTQTGDRVTVFVSATYENPEGVGLRWANFLSSLVHGSELPRVRAYIAPLAEVEAFCEARAYGCYGGNTLVAMGDTVGGVTAEEVVRHEYGHHVAANRQNPPWAAIDWGTKRWASEAGICRRAAGGTAFPGDEGLLYTLNPGEAFAEAYRVLNEVRGGATTFAWELADPSFRPDETELEAVEADVLRPWSQAAPLEIAARFPGRARTWTRAISTPLDGDLEITLRVPLGAGHALELLGRDDAVLVRGAWSGSGTRTIRYRVCGERAVRIRVGRAPGAPRFRLHVRVP